MSHVQHILIHPHEVWSRHPITLFTLSTGTHVQCNSTAGTHPNAGSQVPLGSAAELDPRQGRDPSNVAGASTLTGLQLAVRTGAC